MNKTSVEGKARCSYCKATITAENEHLPRIDYRETELIKLINNLIQNTPITCNVLNLDIGDIILNNRIMYDYY